MSIIGLGSIAQAIYLLNSELTHGVWIESAEEIHTSGTTLAIVMGSLYVLVGGIGIIGLVNKKIKLLFTYNVFSVIFLIVAIVLGSLSAVVSRTVQKASC